MATPGVRGSRGGLNVLLSAALLSVAAMAGCEEPPESTDFRASGAVEPTATDAWVRVPLGAAPPDGVARGLNTAAYLTLRNPGHADDALVGVETAVADTAELHSVSMDDDDVMRMRPVEAVPVPGGEDVVLEPGGYHVMLLGLREPLEPGDTIPLTLRLQSGGELDVRAEVRRSSR